MLVPQRLRHFTLPPATCEGPNLSTPCPALLLSKKTRDSSRPIGSRWHLAVALCVSLMSDDVERLFMACRPFVCLLWRAVYSDPFPIYVSSCYCVVSSSYILDKSPYQTCDLPIFSPFCVLLLILQHECL